MPPLEPVYDDSRVLITTQRNLLLMLWRDAPTIVQMREFGRAGQRLARSYPKGSGLWNVMVSGKPTFGDDVREETLRMSRDKTLFPLGTAHVVLLDGLTGAAIRGFLGTMILVGRPASPTKVFGDAQAAADWMAGGLTKGPAPLTRAEILAAHAEALEKVRAPPAP